MKLKDGTPIKFVKVSEVGGQPRWYVSKTLVDKKLVDLYDLPDSVEWFHYHEVTFGEENEFYCAVVDVAEGYN